MYARLCAVPAVSGASISQLSASQASIELQTTQKSLAQEMKKQMLSHYIVTAQHSKLDIASMPFPVESSTDILLTTQSPSGRFRAIQRTMTIKEKKQRFVEIWERKELKHCFNVTKYHAEFCTDDTFALGQISWSSDESALAYIAEPDTSSTTAVSEEDPDPFKKYAFKEDWGEKFPKRTRTHIVLITLSPDTAANQVKVLDKLDETANQVIFGPGDTSLIFRTVYANVRKYGIVFCPNRPAQLHQLDLTALTDLTQEYQKQVLTLTPADKAARSPRLSPDGQSLFFLQNDLGGPHFGCSRLLRYDFQTRSTSTVIDLIPIQKDGDKSAFPGLYCDTLPGDGWIVNGDGKLIGLVVNTQWRCQKAIVHIDLQTCQVTRVLPNGEDKASYSMLCLSGHWMVVSKGLTNEPQQVLVGKLNAGDISSVTFTELYRPTIDASLKAELDKVKVDIRQHETQSHVESVLVTPKHVKNPPLITFPHGGPHSAFSTDWSVFVAGFCLAGYAVAMVNYTGSIGYGQKWVVELLGKIGQLDIEDTHYFSQLFKKELGSKSVVLFGGSHGGFVTGWLVGKYPKFYAAGVLRNPVLNVGTNLVQSDIPDWSYLEAGVDFSYTNPAYPSPPPAVYTHLHTLSPVSHVHHVTAPLLFLLGKEDKRVPNYEALNWYYYLKGQGKKPDLLMFEGENHGLDGVLADRACFEATVGFFERVSGQ